MKKFLIFLLVIVVLLLGAVGVAAYVLRDANTFKGDLVALIKQQTDLDVTIAGDLSWRLLPPLSIRAADVTVKQPDQTVGIAFLSLDLDLLSALGDPEHWKVQALTLEGIKLTDEDGNITDVRELTLKNLAPGERVPFSTAVTYTSSDPATDEPPPIPNPLEATLDGHLIFQPGDAKTPMSLKFEKTRIESEVANGVCDVNATENPKPLPEIKEHRDDLIPVNDLRAYDFTGNCLMSTVTYAEETFKDVTVRFDNKAAKTQIDVGIPKFFGGTLGTGIALNAAATPVRWTVKPNLTNVDTQQFTAWLNSNLQWIAPLAVTGDISMSGNREEQLLRSMKGKSSFDGGKGQINISALKGQIGQAAMLMGKNEKVANWPDMWSYERMKGDWTVNGIQHVLDFALDNLLVVAEGQYDPVTDKMDLLAKVTVDDKGTVVPFQVNPLLMGLPIPVHCTGSIEEPKCRLDSNAAQSLVAGALRGDSPALRSKLDEKIDKEVPEQYRDAARSLLDAFGGGSRNKKESTPEE